MNSERANDEYKKQNADLKTKLILAESNLKNSLFENKTTSKEFEEIQMEIKTLNSNYKETNSQNNNLKNEISIKNTQIEQISNELHNVKEVLGKLTDVKNILNQHFSGKSQNINNNYK